MRDISVKLEHINAWGVITLQKQSTLNALDLEMVLAIRAFLKEAGMNTKIQGVLIQSNVPGVFCAGGDVKAVYRLYQEKNQKAIQHYITEEYGLNQQIHSFKKPVVAIIDGLALGGGVGLSRYARYRIATRRAIVGMPEIKIAFFPDVGAGYFLNLLKPSLARFLALTGYTLAGQDLIDTGYATHVISEECDLKKMIEQIINHPSHRLASALPEYSGLSGKLQDLESLIDCFKYASLLQCLTSLQKCSHVEAAKLYSELSTFSPLALHVVWRYIEITHGLDYESVVKIDLELAQRMFSQSDMFEGIRTRLINKNDTPKWRHLSLNSVSEQEVQSYFSGLL
jgi:enoyl-CoA hydratase/carnithine racemase